MLAEAKVVTLGVYENYPACYRDKNGEYNGIYVDILNEIAKQENWEIKYYYNSWSNCLDKARKSQLDLVCALLYTEERSLYLKYSNVPALTRISSFKTNKYNVVKSIQDLEGKKIGIIRSDANSELLIKLCLDNSVNPIIVYYNHFSEVLLEIKKNNLIGGIFITYNNKYDDDEIIESSISFGPRSSFFASSKNTDPDIINKIDKYLTIWKDDRNSIYYKILDNYLNNKSAYNFH